MKVKLEWSEEVTYYTTLDIDEEEITNIRLWLTMDGSGVYHPEQMDDTPLTAADVGAWFDSGGEADWFDRCDTDRDFYGVTDRKLEDVTEVKEAPPT